MSDETNYRQPGFFAVTPYLYGGLELIDFLKQVFGAEETHRGTPDAAGNLHSEVKIGDSHVLLGKGYFTDPSMAAALYIYVKDVDATYARALGAGATSVRAAVDYPWGDRIAGVKDSFGNTWWIATHKPAK
jgi:PhnB protein